MTPLATAGPTAYWYLTRSTGTIATILLTLSVALGVANIRRLRTANVPRFVVDAIHRDVSLLATAFVVVHILTSVLDSFAPISLLNAVIPFTGTYRPLWVGLGAVAFDLLIALMLTSLLRRRFGYRAWRLTHWVAYVCWPVALLHGIGTGSDTKTGWMLVIVAGCVIVLVVAVVARATDRWGDHLGASISGLGAAAVIPIGLLVWLPSGPLAAGWAKRAGTPASLLRASSPAPSSGSSAGSGASPPGTSASPSFTAQATGTIQQGLIGDGLAGVDISLALSGQQLSTLAIHLRGQALQGGGIEMTSSVVTLGTRSNPGEYRGQVTSLQGTNVAAQVTDPSGKSLIVQAQLQIDPNSGNASGTVTVQP